MADVLLPSFCPCWPGSLLSLFASHSLINKPNDLKSKVKGVQKMKDGPTQHLGWHLTRPAKTAMINRKLLGIEIDMRKQEKSSFLQCILASSKRRYQGHQSLPGFDCKVTTRKSACQEYWKLKIIVCPCEGNYLATNLSPKEKTLNI